MLATGGSTDGWDKSEQGFFVSIVRDCRRGESEPRGASKPRRRKGMHLVVACDGEWLHRGEGRGVGESEVVRSFVSRCLVLSSHGFDQLVWYWSQCFREIVNEERQGEDMFLFEDL